jgi:hypothetical protein
MVAYEEEGTLHPDLGEAGGLMLSPDVAEQEEAAIAQEASRARDWARANAMNLKRAEALEQERWDYCTRGTINRWFDEMSGLVARVNPEMLWSMDEVMIAASRAGLEIVSPNQILFERRSGRTPHVTVAPCFNPRGESTPLLLVFPTPKRVLQDLAAMHQRSFWVAISSKG